MRIRYCPTSFNYADIKTKSLTPAKFAELYAMFVESKHHTSPIHLSQVTKEQGREFLEDYMLTRSGFTDSGSSLKDPESWNIEWLLVLFVT